MKKFNLKKIIVGVLLCLVGYFGGDAVVDNLGSSGRVNLVRTKCDTATSTPTYFAGGAATSTCLVYIGDAKQVEINGYLNASSTSSILEITSYVSYDDGINKNYFNMTNSSQSSGVDTLAKEVKKFTAPASGDNFINFPIDNIGLNIGQQWLKLEYGVTGAAGGVYLEVITQNDKY